MKRLLATLCLLMALGAPLAFAQTAPQSGAAVWPYLNKLQGQERLDVMYREGKREGSATIYGAIGFDRMVPVIDAFKKKYPGIDVTFVRLTESDTAQRVQTEARAGHSQGDLVIQSAHWFTITGPTLAPYEMTSWSEFDPRFRHGSMKDGWTAFDFESLVEVIAWRTDRVKSDEAPKTIDQLANPKWKGRVGTTSAREQFIDAMTAIYGEKPAMQKVDALAALENRTYQSIAAVSQAIATGDVDVAWGLSGARAYALKASGAPVDYVLQDPPTGLNVGIGVLKLAQHPYAAALFMDFFSQADFLSAWDKIEPGRVFGNTKGAYTIPLSAVPNLFIYRTLSPERYKALNRIFQDKFLRQR